MYISQFSNKDYSLDNEEKVLRWYYKNPQVELNTRYDRAIENIESVFDVDDIYYGIFEDFFNPAQVSKLCNFLGIDYIEPDFTPVNSYSTKNEIDPSLINEIREYYSGVYDYVYNKFGYRW
jgi:hypothetical protein